jgi:hypothetical protein
LGALARAALKVIGLLMPYFMVRRYALIPSTSAVTARGHSVRRRSDSAAV